MANESRLPGFTSTASKRPEAVFGGADAELPGRVIRTSGCRAWDASGREYVDYFMALGAVGLGYGHPDVTAAATAAVRDGVVGPLPPVVEGELAEALADAIPWLERCRFFKTGAESLAAAVRLARVVTGRDLVLGCGYHGWLDWCQGDAVAGVPAATRALFRELPFNDVAGTRALIREHAPRLAAVVVEPLVVSEPAREWLEVLRAECTRAGAVLVFDEVKTAFRLAVGGAAERYGVQPDLMCLGKALANGFPLAALGGRRPLMDAITRTWVSSTLATESVSLAAALATLRVYRAEHVCEHLHRIGTRLLHGLHRLQHAHPDVITGVGGVAEMCFLHYVSDDISQQVARGCARRGVLFKRTAYNFVSLAHDEATVDRTLGILEETVASVQ
jgi:glutamate-1-semialdehyde aminotransferase